jgi:hypothetical protein
LRLELITLECILKGKRFIWWGSGYDKCEKEKATQAAKNHSLHYLRKISHFGTGYRKTPPKKKEKDQWGSGGLQA